MAFFYTDRVEGSYSGGELKPANVWFAAIATSLFILIAWMALHPMYSVWAAKKQGEAQLAQANQNRQITVTEAEAQNTAATSQAQAKIKIAQAEATAEVERAKGVAQANAIIGDSLKGNEDYLRYLYITGITGKANQIIYVPTEGSLPLLEAGRATK